MKSIEELNFPSDVKYTDDHEWAKVEGDLVTVGISDYAQDQLGEIVFVEMPEIGDTFGQGDEFGSVESVKAVSEIFLPIAGEIVEVNEELEDAPELVNTNCYDKGWLVKIKPDDLSEMDSLKDQTAYFEMLKG
ncbi:glycine cleavage system protein GcvH [uncultured Desulfobacter sp.]|uniref:glycine cleavage system protein GcvH n=1 Tax=uncultured Desulfobacter sp. TaxID=240139 RepID=UPI0029F4AC21|nr:glycine cleavage system protein GcvH [uncultured Desulfobacter sp.]